MDIRRGALLTDLYELNMAASYLRRGMTQPATFSLFVRRLPPERGFLVAAGLDACLAFLESFFFIGYLVSIALFGLYQAIFMANAGGAWDNAKKIVEVELKEKGTALHAATVVGDTVGDPFKDTSSVAMNPVIKFTTLFGLLAVELAVSLTADRGASHNGFRISPACPPPPLSTCDVMRMRCGRTTINRAIIFRAAHGTTVIFA